jgi:putative membrane protein
MFFDKEYTMNKIFKVEELEKIKMAVEEAEKETSAEIVPVFFESSGAFRDTFWKSGILFATFFSFIFLIYYHYSIGIWGLSPQIFFLLQMAFGLLGVIAVFIFPSWKRLLIDRHDLKKRIRDISYRVFLEEEVFNTKERTGMLLFMSFFEREAVVLGDVGINGVVSQEIWEGILKELTEGMKKGNKTEAIVHCIHSMGNLLKQYPIRSNDINELKNDLRIGDGK